MSDHIAAYGLPTQIARFRWQRFARQEDRRVTYMYVSKPAIRRVRGLSPILYVGETEQTLAKRVRDEMHSNNTPGNTQNTNIRLSAIFAELSRAGHSIETYFTQGLAFSPSPADLAVMLDILHVWDKRAWVELTQKGSPAVEVSIEKFVLCHYAAAHLELPPMNNSM
jgi:hypothetical protein